MAEPSGSIQPSLGIGEGFLPEGVGIVAVGVKRGGQGDKGAWGILGGDGYVCSLDVVVVSQAHT